MFAKIYNFNNLPIRYKLIVHFMIISILPSICLGFMISWTVNNVISKQVNENTLQLMGKANKSLEDYIGGIQNITYLISFNPQIKEFLELEQASAGSNLADEQYEIKQFLQGFTTLHYEVAGILVINNKGEYISNEMYARSTKLLTDEQWYEEAVSNAGIFKLIGHPVGRNVTTHYNYRDDELVSGVRAILDPETQETKGVILIDLKLRVIAETLKDVRLGKSGFLMVIDDQGKGIYTPASPFTEGIMPEWFSDRISGNFSKKINGEELQFIYRKSPFTNWTTVGVFSTNEAIYEVQEIRFYMVSFIFLVTFLGITASFYLAYSISRPIQRLKKYMQIAESGDLLVRDFGNRTDEIGMLGQSFNNMLLQTKKLISLVEVKERQKKDAELRVLHANIKPHFLYNTLDTIHWLAKKNGADEATDLVDSLSKLFRIGLSNGQEIIPLINEVEHVISYLKIQKTRYKDKLDYEVHIDPHLNKYYLLKLILQPIVENAIYHGIKERRGPGIVRIHAELQRDCVLLTVTDDGLGMNEETLRKLSEKLQQTLNDIKDQSSSNDDTDLALKMNELNGGYGLVNVHTRIVLSFGEPYGLSVKSEEGIGTTVAIKHPILNTNKGVNPDGGTMEDIDRR